MKFEINLDYKALLEQIKLLTTVDTSVKGLTPILKILTTLRDQMEELPDYDPQRLIENYLPNYSSREDVLEVDILTRYFDKEEISNEDAEWVVGIGSDYERKRYMIETYTSMFYEALKNFEND